jgi:DNA polymerase-3 subunit delta'
MKPALLPWHAANWRRVSEAIRQGRLAHALLLSGAGGTGKRAFAQVLAGALLCRAPDAQSLPCGVCGDCRQLAAGAHPGFALLRPEEDKRDIGIDAVREVCSRLTLTSHDGRAKLALIDPADALNLNGVNALLKTIEEPPPRCTILLLAQRPLALRATLRSRCQNLRFAIPPRVDAQAWLAQAEPAATPAARDAALELALGAPLAARQLLGDGALDRQVAWFALMSELSGGNGDPLAAAAGIGEDRAAEFLQWLFACLRRLLAERLGLAAAGTDSLPAAARILPQRAVDAYITELQECLRRLESNAKAQLVLESMLIRWRSLTLSRTARA